MEIYKDDMQVLHHLKVDLEKNHELICEVCYPLGLKECLNELRLVDLLHLAILNLSNHLKLRLDLEEGKNLEMKFLKVLKGGVVLIILDLSN